LLFLFLCLDVWNLESLFSPFHEIDFTQTVIRLTIFTLRKSSIFTQWCLVYTGCPESHLTKRKLNISTMVRANELTFLAMIEACSKYITILTCLERAFVKYYCWPQLKKITFSRLVQKSLKKKKIVYLRHFSPKSNNSFFIWKRNV
jgi:hypothetical protein